MTTAWYHINNLDQIDTPALAIFPDRIQHNIDTMIAMTGDVNKLWPHVKTHKMKEVIDMQISNGFQRFKCATIAEAEMLAIAGANEILLAYQPVGPKMQRILQLVKSFPNSKFSALVDNKKVATQLSNLFETADEYLGVFLDIDNGQHRTGINPTDAFELYQHCIQTKALITKGLHVYDGHHRGPDLEIRMNAINEDFKKVETLVEKIETLTNHSPIVIVGGSPAFPAHAKRPGVLCSPGTVLLWDWGYGTAYKEMDFQFAGIVITRIISKPAHNRLCVDLGHKAVAADKPLPRVHFLNLPEGRAISHSEEHLVLEVEDNSKYEIGMVLYGVPVHICPTCALHEKALVIRNHKVDDTWSVMSRVRMLSI